MPSPGFVGAWVIGGVTYNATAATSFKQLAGPLAVGICAKVHYSGSASPFSAREIESEPTADCSWPTPIPSATPSATPSNEIERYGRIECFTLTWSAQAAGVQATTWVVGGGRCSGRFSSRCGVRTVDTTETAGERNWTFHPPPLGGPLTSGHAPLALLATGSPTTIARSIPYRPFLSLRRRTHTRDRLLRRHGLSLRPSRGKHLGVESRAYGRHDPLVVLQFHVFLQHAALCL